MPTLSDSVRIAASASARPALKSRRIAALLPEIQAEIAKGYTLAQISQALKDFDIAVTAKELSTYLARLAKRKAALALLAPGSPPTQPRSPAQSESLSRTPQAAVAPEVRKEVPAHDPRFIENILSTPPDMKELAKRGRKGLRP